MQRLERHALVSDSMVLQSGDKKLLDLSRQWREGELRRPRATGNFLRFFALALRQQLIHQPATKSLVSGSGPSVVTGAASGPP